VKLRIEEIRLIGAERKVVFKPGLNIISGSIATGKTTLYHCIQGLLGHGLSNFSHESRKTIRSIGGHLIIGNESFDIIRPFVSTRTALVDIAGDSETNRLPVLQGSLNSSQTYGQWLLKKLGLPLLEVPNAPTQIDSDLSPVTINDYLMYCNLRQGEIDDDVFGHSDQFKNIKRKYVFDILYGKYDIEVASLRDELRNITIKLRRHLDQANIFSEFLAGTRFENQAQIEREAVSLEKEMQEINSKNFELSEKLIAKSRSTQLRDKVLDLDEKLSNLNRQLEFENEKKSQLERLLNQLKNQNNRLTRAIVTGDILINFDFIICPRCGSALNGKGQSDEICYLCNNPIPTQQIDKADLIAEQDRLNAQIIETQELIYKCDATLYDIISKISDGQSERENTSNELSALTASFVSDQASHIAEIARKKAELFERSKTLKEFLEMHSRFQNVHKRIVELQNQKNEIQAKLEIESKNLNEFEERILYLENTFRSILDKFQRPEFPTPGRTGLDRKTYLPIVDGRRFEELQSQGLMVMVNVAHALSHQLTSFKFDTRLPNILLIDGLTGNMGYEGLDQERIEAIYRYLIQMSNEYANRLQIIVVDNSVPDIAKSFIRLELTESNKLIPSHILISETPVTPIKE